jgi:hypothetical protein
MSALLFLQCGTFLALGGMFIAEGKVKLGVAQILLAGIQWLIYS